MELTLTSDVLYIGICVCVIISVLILVKLTWHNNNENLFFPGYILLLIITVAVLLFGIYPIEQKENHDFYEDNIRDAVIHATENTTDINEKVIQIRSICALFTEIPQSKCIEYARENALRVGG